MAVKNSKLIDEKTGTFSVLDAINVRLTGPYLWHADDINEENCIGSIFRLFDEEARMEIAYIMLVDATNDSTEPDISRLEEDAVAETDQYLFEGIVSGLKQDGMGMVEWMSSYLKESDGLKALNTAYIKLDQGKERQEFQMRITLNGRKWVLLACFDVARADELATPIIGILRDARLVKNEDIADTMH